MKEKKHKHFLLGGENGIDVLFVLLECKNVKECSSIVYCEDSTECLRFVAQS